MCHLDAGVGIVDVAVLDPHGHKDTVRPMVTQRSEFIWNVDYTPKEQGLHSVNVFFAGKAIPYSPFPVGVAPGQCICFTQGQVSKSHSARCTLIWIKYIPPPLSKYHCIYNKEYLSAEGHFKGTFRTKVYQNFTLKIYTLKVNKTFHT